ncbi:ArsR family transcriptional regulator [Litoreibacter ponti]|uniref:ArsR family transcriptional regulator n=1 Tax=Litoreibacter ponti TaxID=1510457 RepID=A0A2T6BMW1_9RHOB|nr:metalloregulator ArsR/SmtB family transcription factor [Litoreibacter ponti]PTX57430.1 ArsR family transcriptional regulator [Litoreibacter ponti]
MKTFIDPDLSLVEAASAYAALGSEQRLQLLRTLTRSGAQGMSIGSLGEATGLSGANLTHHLKILANSGLIQQTRQGRSVICAMADTATFKRLNDFLLAECCADLEDHHHG